MPKNGKEKTLAQSDKEGAFSGENRVPFDLGGPNYMVNYLQQKKTQERMAESIRKSNPKLSTKESMLMADEKLAGRAGRVKETKTFIGSVPGGFAEAKGAFPGIRDTGEVVFSPKSLEEDPTGRAVHEFSHIATQNVSDLPEADIETFERNLPNIQPLDMEFGDVDEMKARSDFTRWKAGQLGIFDPLTEDFTEEHYDKLSEHYDNNFGEPGTNIGDNAQQFLRNTSKESAIEILNTVAQIAPTESEKKPWGLA